MDSPIEFPVILIGSRRLVVKFDFLAQFKLDEMGVDTRQLGSMLRGQTGTVATLVKLFTAAVAHNYVDAGEVPPNADMMAVQIQREKTKRPELWQQICNSLTEALGKVEPPAASPAPVVDQTTGQKTN